MLGVGGEGLAFEQFSIFCWNIKVSGILGSQNGLYRSHVSPVESSVLVARGL